MREQDVEKWLFSDDELTPEQAKILEDEMKRSEELRDLVLSWAQVEGLFSTADVLQAPAGFASRWQEQLAIRDENARRRQLKWFLVIAIAMVLLTLSLFVLLIFNLATSPAEIIVTGLQRLMTVRSTLGILIGFGSATLEIVPTIAWVPILSVTSFTILGLIAAWIVSLYRFAYIGVRNGV